MPAKWGPESESLLVSFLLTKCNLPLPPAPGCNTDSRPPGGLTSSHCHFSWPWLSSQCEPRCFGCICHLMGEALSLGQSPENVVLQFCVSRAPFLTNLEREKRVLCSFAFLTLFMFCKFGVREIHFVLLPLNFTLLAVQGVMQFYHLPQASVQ